MALDDHKAAILRRRALFVTSALTAIVGGCEAHSSPGVSPSSTSEVAPAETRPLPVATASATAGEQAGPALTAPPPPPVVIPEQLNATAKAHYERLAQDVPAIWRILDEVAGRIDFDCTATSAGCDPSYFGFAKSLAKAKDQLRDLAPHCRGQSPDARQFDETLSAHRSHILTRLAALEERIFKLAASREEKARWQEHQRKAVIPRPCLRFACKPW